VSRRRLLAAAIATAAIAAAATSCTAIIGGIGPDDNTDVVGKLCRCGGDLAFLGPEAQCRDYLQKRFDGMTADERQAWLELYADECKSCETAKKCFYQAPVCRESGCTADWECCSSINGGGCKDGICF